MSFVVQIMRDLGKLSRKDHTLRFQFIEVNALRLPSPKHVYSLVYESLTGRYVGPQSGDFDVHSVSKLQDVSIVLT